MAGMSDWLEGQIRNLTLRPGQTVTLVQPEAVYVGLFTVAPGEAGGGTEVSGGGYERQEVTFDANGTNSATVTFPTATANWGTIVACAIFDAAEGGNMFYFGNLAVSRTINSGDVFKFEAGNLTITLD